MASWISLILSQDGNKVTVDSHNYFRKNKKKKQKTQWHENIYKNFGDTIRKQSSIKDKA